MPNKLLKGKVIRASGDEIHNHYFIKTENGDEYFAHMGDLKANEKFLEDPKNSQLLSNIEVGDEVTFVVNDDRPHAFHVKKVA